MKLDYLTTGSANRHKVRAMQVRGPGVNKHLVCWLSIAGNQMLRFAAKHLLVMTFDTEHVGTFVS